MPRDRVKALFEVLANSDVTKVREEGERILSQIQEDISALHRDAKIVRELLGRYGGAEDLLTPRGRSAKVREAALALVQGGRQELTAQDVIDHLIESQGIEFDVRRPASMAGTILSQMNEFERVAMNRFKYVGEAGNAQNES